MAEGEQRMEEGEQVHASSDGATITSSGIPGKYNTL